MASNTQRDDERTTRTGNASTRGTDTRDTRTSSSGGGGGSVSVGNSHPVKTPAKPIKTPAKSTGSTTTKPKKTDPALSSYDANGVPQPPKALTAAAKTSGQLGQDWLDFAKGQFKVTQQHQNQLDDLTSQWQAQSQKLADANAANTAKLTDKQINIADRAKDAATDISQAQVAQANANTDYAAADRQRYEQTFVPVEQQFASDAMNYDSADRQAEAAAEAAADVQSAAGIQRAATERNLASMGVNPNAGRFAGIERANDLGTALARAGAENTARSDLRDKGIALRAQAADLGRGLNQQAQQETATSLGANSAAAQTRLAGAGLGIDARTSAINAGTNAVNNQIGVGQTAIGLTQGNQSQRLAAPGIVDNGYTGALGGTSQQAGIEQNIYSGDLQKYAVDKASADQDSQGLWGAIGSGIGLAASTAPSWLPALTALSSRDYKTDKQPIGDGEALKAVNNMPVERWRYRPGIADGGTHVGTYAENFRASTGQGDGKTIPLQDAIGVTMRAVQDLDRKLDRRTGAERTARPQRAAGLSRAA